MSQENVEVVRASFEAWNAGDMAAYGELLDPNATMRPQREWPEQGPFAGRDEVIAQYLRIRDALDADVAEPLTAFVHAADRVVCRFRWRGTGHGPEMNIDVSCIYTVRYGKIVSFEFFTDHAEALETVGLSE